MLLDVSPGGYPLYTGLYSLDTPIPLSVTLAGRDYPIDLTKYRHNGLPKFRDGVATQGGAPDDQLYDSQGAWWRYRFSFDHGAGQRVVDLDEADPKRFATSRGIDPWTRFQGCMIESTTPVLDVAAVDISMIATATHCYVADGATLQRSADLITWTPITAITGTILSLTTDGTNVYAGTTTGIFTVGSSTVAVAGPGAAPIGQFTNVAFVGNRLLAGDNNLLVEIGATTNDTIFTHFQPAFRWTTIFQVGSRIYCGGFAGNRTELYSITAMPDGSLSIEAEAASFFSNELLRDGMSYGGAVVLATSKGVRFASLGSDASLQYGPAIDAPGDVKCLCAEGRFAWFGWTGFPDTGRGVGRLALDTFVDTMQPAYASDVYHDDASGDVVAATRFNGRTLFATSAGNVYASNVAAYVTTAWMELGELYFGTVEDKSVSSIRLRTNPLTAGQSASIEMFESEGASLGVGMTDTDGAVTVTLGLEGQISNRVTGRITLTGPGTSRVCLRQWRVRAYPIAPATEEWLVPLLISSRVVVGDGEGQVLSLDPWDCISELKAIWRSSAVVPYREGDHTHHVRIDNFEQAVHDWRDGADWFEGVVCTVRLLSV